MKELYKAKCCHFCRHFKKVSEDSPAGYYYICKKRSNDDRYVQQYYICDDFEIEKPKLEMQFKFKD